MYYDKEELLFKLRMKLEDVMANRYAREIEKFKSLQMAAVMNSPTEQFKELKKHRDAMSKKLYVMYLKMFFKNSVRGVDVDTLLDAFKGVKRKALMDRHERKVYKRLPDTITVYRGTHTGEDPLRLSWALDYETAYRFSKSHINGCVYMTEVHKEDIIALFIDQNSETEVVVNVKGEVKTLDTY